MAAVTRNAVKPAVPQVREGQFSDPEPLTPAASVDEAIERTHGLLRDIQASDGWWWGELESNPTMEAEFIFLRHILGITDPSLNRKIGAHIAGRQLPDGGWNMYFGGQGDLSTSVECYTALKIAGWDAESAAMRNARDFILSKGGVSKTRVFTKIWLAMIGQWDWSGTPYLPPEIMLVPNWAPFNIYSFASWTRATVVPMTIILSERPTYPLDAGHAIDELYPDGRANTDYSLPAPSGHGIDWIVFVADRLLHSAEKLPVKPLRGLARKKVKDWIVERQGADGSWGGIQPPWVYSLIALRELGLSMDDPVIEHGLAGFDSFAIEDQETWRLQACVSPVWDTCLTVNALVESGMDPEEETVTSAVDWLVSKQIKSSGDWQVKNRDAEPGGWAFEFDNDSYPDTDDAAEVLLAVARGGTNDPDSRDRAVDSGMKWLLSMQSRNGGWGSFDRNNTSQVATKLPFFDFGEVIDPPSVDVTAHVLEAVGALGWPTDTEGIRKAVEYIWSEQEPDGPWFGRWGVNYLYGVSSVLPALEAIGFNMNDNRVQNAANWVESRQNSDGGWGESCASYADPKLRGSGESSASQTAWALIALMAAGHKGGENVDKGVKYLIQTQRLDGAWTEPQYTATGFPGYGLGDRRFKGTDTEPQGILPLELPAGFMIKYHMYRIYWPLLALGRFRASGGSEGESVKRGAHQIDCKG